MNLTVRSVATALAIGFGAYFSVRAVWWTQQPAQPILFVSAVLLYLGVLVTAVLLESAAGLRLPLWWATVVVLTAAAVPTMVNLALAPEMRTAPFSTWYIGGVGLLGVVAIVRRRSIEGWLTLLGLALSSATFLGVAGALELGLVGSIMWIFVAQLLLAFWDRAVRDTERLAEIQQAASAWRITQQVQKRERRVRVQHALAAAGPLLTRTVAAHGVLTEEERLEARLAEGLLRDELRGATLLNDAVRAAIQDARRRGVSVTVFDEGGLDDIDEDRRTEIRDELAGVLAHAMTGRLIIRAARDDRTAVTVVGRPVGAAASDEDAVDLWHEITREFHAD